MASSSSSSSSNENNTEPPEPSAAVTKPQTAVVSVAKTLTSLTAVASNRTCAECRTTLVDASQVFISFSPCLDLPRSRYNHFLLNHQTFAPPGYKSKAPEATKDPPVDPSLLAAGSVGEFGVFVCAPCAAAHKLLGSAIATVRAAQDPVGWTLPDVERLAQAGGNHRSLLVFEAFLPPSWERKRPSSESSVADRLTFVRAKYEALSFVLPRTGPLAPQAWRKIVNMHTEWRGLWGADLLSVAELDLRTTSTTLSPGTPSSEDMEEEQRRQQQRTELPDRLVDFFCVATASDYLYPTMIAKDLSSLKSPEEVLLAPQISDSYPPGDTYEDTEFPEHVSTFVFPEGCHAKSTRMPPSLFTFVLTAGSGDRLYGAVLRIYDDGRDIEDLRMILKQSGYVGPLPKFLEETDGVVFFPKCLIVLSHYPFFDLWRNFLTKIYRIALVEAPLPIERFIANFVREIPLPPPGNIRVKFGFTVHDLWLVERPPENELPLVNFSYKPLFSCLSVSNVMVVMGCLLQETRVALVSQHYALLCPVAEALLSLLFPFRWSGMYLPVLPCHMMEMLEAPVPYLVGLHSRYLVEVPIRRRPHGVVFVDLDRDQVHLGFTDPVNGSVNMRMTPALPDRQALKLKTRLGLCAASAYLLPLSKRAGTLTTGNDIPVPYEKRDAYTYVQGSETPAATGTRRDAFGKVDRAYTDNELQVPIRGFLSEHGQFYEEHSIPSSSPDAAPRAKNGRFRFGKHKSVSDVDSDPDETRVDGLLDLREPANFQSIEIRRAFLRFFVSLFRDYRQFITDSGFQASEFIASLNFPLRTIEFLSALLESQMFQCFIHERIDSPDDPEVRFFDESITEKENRSRKASIAKIGRGGKKETTFLNDLTTKITDTFTPPPPSNWGLPDDGRSYQYPSFPKLNPELFGKTRTPRPWPHTYKSRSFRKLRQVRRMSNLTQENEKAIVQKAMAPVVKTHEVLTAVSRRGVKTLEGALGALSAPFIPTHSPQDTFQPASPAMSELTVGSAFLDPGRELLSSAEEVVLNARRKQAILIGIMIKFQAYARIYLAKSLMRELQGSATIAADVEDETETESPEFVGACVGIQSWMRKEIARHKFSRVKYAASQLGARSKGRRIRLAFVLLLDAISRTQAAARGFVFRKRVRDVVAGRLQVYRECIFFLWRVAHTPLSYRSKLWPVISEPSFVRLSIARAELRRLWGELKVETDTGIDAGMRIDDLTRLSASAGLSNVFYLKAKKVHKEILAGSYKKSASAAADREAAERMQVYERLSMSRFVTAEQFSLFLESFSVPKAEKMKKAVLAKTIWGSFEDADKSAEFMVKVFPELISGPDIFFMEPSKKGLRRIPSDNPVPGPLSPDMWAHTRLGEIKDRNVAEVADVAMREVPCLIGLIAKEDKWKRREDFAYLRRGKVGERRLRLNMMRELVANEKAKARLSLPGDRFWEEESERAPNYPGAGFWEDGVEDEDTDHLPGQNFWEGD